MCVVTGSVFQSQVIVLRNLAEQTETALVRVAKDVAQKAIDGVLTSAAIDFLKVRQEKAEAATEVLVALDAYDKSVSVGDVEAAESNLLAFFDDKLRTTVTVEHKLVKAEFYADTLLMFRRLFLAWGSVAAH